MRTEDVSEFVHRRPFRPFRVTLTDGRAYEVHHPELAMVGRSSMVIGLPWLEGPMPAYDRAVTVSLLHIMQIEELQPAPPRASDAPGA